MQYWHELSSEEKAIICAGGTESPWSGTYTDLTIPGVFLCRRCDAPLYLSSAKFSSDCGWPSFDDELSHAVIRRLDQDGRRTEILCRRCLAHLGHLFIGEGFTKKNQRHCVNSLSLRFVPAQTSDGYERAFFAGGCFWGVELYLSTLEGVVKTECGYMGGDVVNPTYAMVCTGNTGHAETVCVTFDAQMISYEALVRYFFEIHDPAQLNRQGVDIGTQYRSAIFYLTSEQRDVANTLRKKLSAQGIAAVTEVLPASQFYKAESYHQEYFRRRGEAPSCHIHKRSW